MPKHLPKKAPDLKKAREVKTVPADTAPETAIVQKIEMPVTLRLKLGSLVVHCEEATGNNAHDFDLHAIAGLIQDPEVRLFIEETAKMGILPVKR